MSEQLRKDLRDEIAEGRVVVVVGAGVSIGATKGASVASWDGLLKDGIQRCVDLGLKPKEWSDFCQGLMKTGGTEALIMVAELITSELGGLKSGEFKGWLKESVGSLSIKDAALLKAIENIGAPIVTTNYDNLLEQVTGLSYVTWNQSHKLYDFIRDKRQAIVHLHGHWDEPESVVLGVRSYEDILGDEAAQNALRVLLSTRTLLFVGVGVTGGLSDPNFEALRKWIARVYHTSTHRHYVLVKDDEVEAARSLLPLEGRILPLGYGPQHSDLAGFLQKLAPSSLPPPETVEVIINILEGGEFSIVTDKSSLTIGEQPSSLYPDLDYVINIEGTITNILYSYNVCSFQIHNFEAMIDGSTRRSELISADMPTLLPPVKPENVFNPPRKGFSLKFRASRKPSSSIRIFFDVSFSRYR
jgi:hypothetical protein